MRLARHALLASWLLAALTACDRQTIAVAPPSRRTAPAAQDAGSPRQAAPPADAGQPSPAPENDSKGDDSKDAPEVAPRPPDPEGSAPDTGPPTIDCDATRTEMELWGALCTLFGGASCDNFQHFYEMVEASCPTT